MERLILPTLSKTLFEQLFRKTNNPVMPCINCLCQYCTHNAEELYITVKLVEATGEPCFNCDECRVFTGEWTHREQAREECENFIISEHGANKIRKQFKIVEGKENMERLTSIQTIEHADRTSHEQIYCFNHLWGPAFFKKGTRDYEEYLNIVKRLAEYEDLEEQGKLLKLPCAVGDTVYTNLSMQGWRFKKKDRPYKVKIVFIGINGVNNCMHVAFDNGCMFQFWFSDIGKTVFLTKEAAESALKEMR